MNFNDRHFEEENWSFEHISKVDDKIIKKLVSNLKSDISDDFFISIESLLKLGSKAEPEIETAINEINDDLVFKKEIFQLILDNITRDNKDNYPLLQLYHPDFVIRARAIMLLGECKTDYLKYILPLINDPDDSVRWALLNYLTLQDFTSNVDVIKRLKGRLYRESNPVIHKKIKEILNNEI